MGRARKGGKDVCVCVSHSVMSDSLWPHGLKPTRLLCPWNSQAGILEWVAMPFSSGSSRPRDRNFVSGIAGRFFTIWAIRHAPILEDISQVIPEISFCINEFIVHFPTPAAEKVLINTSLTLSQSFNCESQCDPNKGEMHWLQEFWRL